MPPPLSVRFIGGAKGPWEIERIDAVQGEGLPMAGRLLVQEGPEEPQPLASWVLRGATGNMRYTHRAEAVALSAVQQGLGRPQALCAALIPIRKSAAWWELAQDERRAIFEEQSRHIAIGLDYLPGVARRLHHSRELGEAFDFLTWFEFAPEHARAFDAMLARLRETAEWRFVEREIDIRVRQG